MTRRKDARRKRRPAQSSPASERPNKTIAEFCRDWDISPATFFNWRKDGRAPALTQPFPGGRALITPESETAWIKRFTAVANAATDAVAATIDAAG
jgi:transposase-like protein